MESQWTLYRLDDRFVLGDTGVAVILPDHYLCSDVTYLKLQNNVLSLHIADHVVLWRRRTPTHRRRNGFDPRAVTIVKD